MKKEIFLRFKFAPKYRHITDSGSMISKFSAFEMYEDYIKEPLSEAVLAEEIVIIIPIEVMYISRDFVEGLVSNIDNINRLSFFSLNDQVNTTANDCLRELKIKRIRNERGG